jgi:hypothetical protein
MKINLNTIVVSAFSGLLGILMIIIGWGASRHLDHMEKIQDDQGKTLSEIVFSMREFITRSEFRSEISARDNEITDLKREIEGLRHRIGPPADGKYKQ